MTLGGLENLVKINNLNNMKIDGDTNYCAFHEEQGRLDLKEFTFEELQDEVERIKKIPCTCGLPKEDVVQSAYLPCEENCTRNHTHKIILSEDKSKDVEFDWGFR